MIDTVVRGILLLYGAMLVLFLLVILGTVLGWWFRE